MGLYINPSHMSKEQWLIENGVLVMGVPEFNKTASYFPVCLVDNGPFTAAAIAFDEREMAAFNQPRDYRLKEWYLVQKDKLIEAGFLPKSMAYGLNEN